MFTFHKHKAYSNSIDVCLVAACDSSPRFHFALCGAIMDAHVFARGYCLIGASSLYHFLRTCSLRILLRLRYAKVPACVLLV